MTTVRLPHLTLQRLEGIIFVVNGLISLPRNFKSYQQYTTRLWRIQKFQDPGFGVRYYSYYLFWLERTFFDANTLIKSNFFLGNAKYFSVQRSFDTLIDHLNDQSQVTAGNFKALENFIEANGLNIQAETNALEAFQEELCSAFNANQLDFAKFKLEVRVNSFLRKIVDSAEDALNGKFVYFEPDWYNW